MCLGKISVLLIRIKTCWPSIFLSWGQNTQEYTYVFGNGENLEIENIFWHIKGCGCEQGSSKVPVCRLTLLFSWCEALKVILVCFERQLGSQWYWLSLQVKEMALRKVGGLALWDFLDFIVRTRIPIFVLLRPFIQCKVWCVLLPGTRSSPS